MRFISGPWAVHAHCAQCIGDFLPFPFYRLPHLVRQFSSMPTLKVRQSRNDFFQADVSYKKQSKELYFTTMKPQERLVFWRKLKTPKRHFEINWPLPHASNLKITAKQEVTCCTNLDTLPTFVAFHTISFWMQSSLEYLPDWSFFRVFHVEILHSITTDLRSNICTYPMISLYSLVYTNL